MSRARIHEVSSPISLFPFIGILLCTMGALMVILVAVSRSAHDTAEREIVATQQSEQPDDAHRKKIENVQKYATQIATVREKANQSLSQDKSRLSQVEEHMRRLQDDLQKLVLANTELDSLEAEHYDDRAQAERELSRLKRLLGEGETSLAALKSGAAGKPRSYAVVPYEGENGTFRRPIYVECVANELILQPEGTHITREDLQPPLGPGNALASAIRAARDYYTQRNQNEANSDAAPYPMLLVRPSGTGAYAAARKAIDVADFDFGYEPVEEQWDVNFGTPNPELANIEHQAIVQARARQELLAAAAPRAYKNPELGASGRFELDDESIKELSHDFRNSTSSDAGSSVFVPTIRDASEQDQANPGGPGGGSMSANGANGSPAAARVAQNAGSAAGSGDRYNLGTAGGDNGNSGGAAGQGTTGGGNGLGGNGGGGSGGDGPGGGGGGGLAGTGGSSVATSSGSDGGAQSGLTAAGPGGPNATGNASSGSSAQPPAGAGGQSGGGGAGSALSSGGTTSRGNPTSDDEGVMSNPNANGQSLAVHNGQPNDSPFDSYGKKTPTQKSKGGAVFRSQKRGVAVSRTIRVIVRENQLALIGDDATTRRLAMSGSTIPLERNTADSMEELVNAIKSQVDSWGIAGDGLYWRPVLELQVGPDGQRRADDLNRLLKTSDLELRTVPVAAQLPQGTPNATR